MKPLTEVAHDLNIKPSTLRKYVYQGYVKAEKFGKILVIMPDEITRLMNKYQTLGKV